MHCRGPRLIVCRAVIIDRLNYNNPCRATPRRTPPRPARLATPCHEVTANRDES